MSVGVADETYILPLGALLLMMTKAQQEVGHETLVRIVATVKTTGQTGVEMEALTAVSVACLTIYDMVKAVEKSMRIEGIRLILKDGGKSGRFEVSE